MGKKVQQQYVVKQIIDRRDEKLPSGRINTFYRVLWQGYPESQATWESSRKLIVHPQIRKDIALFNEKRKLIMKAQKKEEKKTVSKGTPNKSKPSVPEASINKSQVTRKTPQPATVEKNTRSPITKEAKLDKTRDSINNQPKNNEVVDKILSKFRENTNNSKPPTPRSADEKKVSAKIKEKITQGQKQEKTRPQRSTKKPTSDVAIVQQQTLDQKPVQEKIKQAILTESKTSKQQSFSESIAEISKELTPIVEQISEKLNNIDRKNDSIEKINEEKSQDDRLHEQEKPTMTENIKLELTDELIHNQNTLINSLKARNAESNGPQGEEEFDIKGMIMCKNEYFYLVEENGKSLILSRAQILNTHPYELICFYERRINIKPAEINMMIL